MLPDIDHTLPNIDAAAKWRQLTGNLLDCYWQQALDIQAKWPAGTAGKIAGHCHACGTEREFLVDYMYSNGSDINWRERLVCQTCGLNNRLRATLRVLDALPHGPVGYITEHLTPFAAYLKRREPALMTSEFVDPEMKSGSLSDRGIRHEDLTCLSFDDNAFDYLVSCDVLEHVPDYRAALREMHRVLRPGGTALLSAPFLPDSYPHLIRASVVDGAVCHHTAPEYHGDPMGGDGILCFYHFGWSILDDLAMAGFMHPRVIVFASEHEANLGAPQLFFAAQK